MREVTRKIHFYAVNMQRRNEQGDPTPVRDTLDVFRYVEGLVPEYGNPQGRYWEQPDGNDLLMEVSVQGDLVYGRFGIKRRTALPAVERRGNYIPLQLQPGSGLVEMRHFIFYSNLGVLGIEYNHFAPRISRWAAYLEEKASHLVSLVEPTLLLLEDPMQTLQRFERLSLLKIRVPRPHVDALQQVDITLHEAFRALGQTANIEELEYELAWRLVSRRRRDTLDVPFITNVVRAIREGPGRECFSAVRVAGRDRVYGRTREVDLLEDQLVTSRQVVTLGRTSRAVQPESMYRAIHDAMDEFHGLIHARGA